MNRRPDNSYSTVELAKLLGVTVQTVQRWVDAGHLQAWRTVGGHRRIDAESVERFRHATRAAGSLRSESRVDTPAPEATPSPTSVNVLLVDDDPADLELLSYLIRRLRPDWALQQVDNGFAALLAIGRQPPQVLITDIAMPYLNGSAMLRTLMANPDYSEMAILAVSSHSPREIADMGGLPAGVGFLNKPVHRTALEQFLAQVEQRWATARTEA